MNPICICSELERLPTMQLGLFAEVAHELVLVLPDSQSELFHPAFRPRSERRFGQLRLTEIEKKPAASSMDLQVLLQGPR